MFQSKGCVSLTHPVSFFQFSHHYYRLGVLFPAESPEVDECRLSGALCGDVGLLLAVTVHKVCVDVVRTQLTVVLQLHTGVIV